ncbi:MAG: hypothetical protein LBD13_05270 [Spirochaetaceae bacterium]|jgi:tetratricopeptide (TPR) repeat protein|nr:hypothetical protein [Spirochaetaceae bacterium]
MYQKCSPLRPVPLAALAAMLLQGCAMTVGLHVQRLPTMNTAGIRRITVMPFDPGNAQDLNREAARFITALAAAKIMDTNRFTLVDPAEITRLQQQGENIENYVDALFIGQVLWVNVKNSFHKEERVNYQTGETYYITVYDREVDLMFNYNFRRARDGSLLGVVTKQGKQSAQNEKSGDLPAPLTMVQAIASSELAALGQDVAPHTVQETRELMKEAVKDKTLQRRMNEAYKLVRAGNYKQALNEYLALYGQYGSIAAGYNGGILYEVMGDLDEAVSFMEELFYETRSPAVSARLGRLRKAAEDRETIARAYGDSRTRAGILIAKAAGLVAAKLPPGAKAAVINNSKAETDLALAMAGGITRALQERGVTIVDRNNTALLAAERQYQMSGEVSDEDFAGIGSEAGVNIFVLVAVTGTGRRRLHIRMLDAERNAVIYQSPQSESMNL